MHYSTLVSSFSLPNSLSSNKNNNITIPIALFGILKNKSKVSKGNFNYDYLAKLNT